MNVCDELLADGWREYQDQCKKYARCFYKTHATPTRCHCNHEKPGISVKISVSDVLGSTNLELDICAELEDGTWLVVKNYAIPKTVVEVTALIPRLLAIWESANQEKP